MSEQSYSAGEVDEAIECARATEAAIRQLRRVTLARPSMKPADVDTVVAHLAGAAAAIPQASRQLSDILERATDDYVLETDSLTEAVDPHVAIGAQLQISRRSANRLTRCAGPS